MISILKMLIFPYFLLEERYKENQTLSVSELYVIGMKKYCMHEEGLENWRKDLMNFVSKEFHDWLNSNDRKDQKKSSEELSLWISTTNISFFFRETWGNNSDNKKKALENSSV